MSLESAVLLAMMLERYFYIAQVDKIWDNLRRTFLTLSALSKQYSQLGESSAEVIAMLLSGPRSLQKLDGMTFEPGRQVIIRRADGVLLLNTWVDPKLSRRQGNVQRFIDHLTFVLNGDLTAVEHLLDWMAFMVQNPGKKMASAVLIIGGQGVGKSLIGEFLATMVGRDNTAFMDAGMIGSAFNGQLLSSNLVVVNEYNSSIGRAGYAMMKHLITGETIFINQKGVPAFQIQNRCNFLLFSNDIDAGDMDRDDRRFFVVLSQAVKRPQEYYTDLCEWFYGEGKHHVLDYLLSRDLSIFNPYAAPPQTAGRAALIRESMSDQVQALYDAHEMGAPPFDIDLVIIADAIEYLNGLRGPRQTVRYVSNFLRAQGAVELGQRRIVDRDGTVRKPRVWALNNAEYWRNCTESQIAAAYARPGTPRPRDAARTSGVEHLDDLSALDDALARTPMAAPITAAPIEIQQVDSESVDADGSVEAGDEVLPPEPPPVDDLCDDEPPQDQDELSSLDDVHANAGA